MDNQNSTHNWETGVLPLLSLAPEVTTPLIGSVFFGSFERLPVVPYIHGPVHSGKHAIASQAAELWSDGVVVDDSDRRQLAEMIRRAYNGMGRYSDAGRENPPAVIAVGEAVPTDGAIAARILPLHLEHPIPLSAMAHTLRTSSSRARQAFRAAFQAWLSQQDHDELYDSYLATWHDDETDDPRLLAGRSAAAYGLTLLGRYLEAEGVDYEPGLLQLPTPGDGRPDQLPEILEYLRSDLPTALEEGEVQLLNSTYTPQKGAPVVGKLTGSRVLLIPSVILGTVLSPGLATSRGLGAALERHGFLRRRDADADVHTTVAKIEGKARRVWDVDCALFGGIPALLGDTYDLEYFTRTRTLTSADAHRLNDLLAAGRNILIAGRAGSGRSTLLRALLNSSPIDSRRLLVGHPEENAELGAIGEWKTATHATAREAVEQYKPDRLYFDELRSIDDARFVNDIGGRRPFVATMHGRYLEQSIAHYRNLINGDEPVGDLVVVQIERDGITWSLQIRDTNPDLSGLASH